MQTAVGRCMIAAILLHLTLAPTAVEAQTSPLQALEPPAPAAAVTIQQPAGRATVTMENTSDLPIAVVAGKVFIHESTGAEVAAEWRSLPANQQPDAESRFMIGARETVTLEARGIFPAQGVYETSVRTAPGVSPAAVFLVSVTRIAAAVPADLLLDPQPVQLQMGLLDSLRPASFRPARKLPLMASNTTATPFELGPAFAGPVARTGAAAGTAIVTDAPPEVGADGDCGSTMPAGASCRLTLTIPRDVGPGSYSIDVSLQGPGGGGSRKAVAFDIRASPWLAALLIAAGVLLGATVADWRGSGRALADRRIAAANLMSRAQRLASSATRPSVQKQAQHLAGDLQALTETLTQGVDPGDLPDRLAERLAQLALAEQALVAAEGLDAGTGALAGLTARLEGALNAGDWSQGRVDTPLAALRLELAAYPELVEAVRRLDERITHFQQAAEILGSGTGTFAETWAAALATREKAFTRIRGATGETAECAARAAAVEEAAESLDAASGDAVDALLTKTADALDAALADPADQKPEARKKSFDEVSGELQVLRQPGGGDRLASAISLWLRLAELTGQTRMTDESTGVAVESVLPPDSALRFVIDAEAFLPGAGASAAELRKVRRVWNLATSGTMLAGIAAAGVLVLWVPNTSWGSVEDVIGALLAGGATRLAIGNIGMRST